MGEGGSRGKYLLEANKLQWDETMKAANLKPSLQVNPGQMEALTTSGRVKEGEDLTGRQLQTYCLAEIWAQNTSQRNISATLRLLTSLFAMHGGRDNWGQNLASRLFIQWPWTLASRKSLPWQRWGAPNRRFQLQQTRQENYLKNESFHHLRRMR